MKGKPDRRPSAGPPARRDRLPGRPEAEAIALAVLGRMVEEPERLGRFLSLTGLDPSTIRAAAREPHFLASILDHVVADEPLLVAVADEIGSTPETVAAAQMTLSPPSDWTP